MIIDDSNGNIIGDSSMSGGDCISNLKAAFNREKKYRDALEKIRDQLKLTEGYKVGHVCPAIEGLINYISDVLGE